ncbi:MAG: ATP-binding cassette domain-containing protein [Lentilactobacillus diolivorans]|jgi:ABC-2 type transport system ATP-binding protein|nr:ATP-binding cassette domain-containing protein [Lentilactobacillus diolivorans]
MLKVTDVNTFIGRKRIVKNVSFQVNSGAIVGLIGPNGAGKTTIMKTILGLTKFTGGISVSDELVTENNHNALSRVGALIEYPAIYPFLTGSQNLELYSYDKQDVTNIVSMLQMDAYINNKAKGYSLGMKQKLGIAIALLNHPKLIILDEPMNGLDVEATIGVRKIIKQYAKQGTAFLISSHILSELQKVMTRVVLINDGHVIVNRDIETFNQISRQKYKLSTERDKLAMQLLESNHISISNNTDNFLVKKEDLFRAQDILYQNKIHLKEILPAEANFEQLIVSILEKQRRQQHEE